ncbi:MAG: outer membrane beta-barrel protein [Bacteroidota bacterium]
MKKICFILLLGFSAIQIMAQNAVGFDAGYLRTHISIAEYIRSGRSTSLLDSVSISPDNGSFQAAFTTDIDLGKGLFLSTGFHYARKGMNRVAFSDSATTYFVEATQHYVGLSVLIEYRYKFKKSRFGIFAGAGPQIDFAVGKPNNGVLYSGKGTNLLMPFCRFSETDLSVAVEAGPTFKSGPGDFFVKLCYHYGLSDVLEDPYVIGRSSSFGISAGYRVRLK